MDIYKGCWFYVKLTKNADFDNYKYSGYGVGVDGCRSFLLSDGCGFGKNVKYLELIWVHMYMLIIEKKIF